MVTTFPDGVRITKTFNHDLLLRQADQERAALRWPDIAPALIDPALIRVFGLHEKRATFHKRLVQIFGSAAVLMMLVALLGYVAELWISASRASGPLPLLATCSELSALGALVSAFFASRYGPPRRRWLKHRFITEVLRQWHFRRLLDGAAIGRSLDPQNKPTTAVDGTLPALIHDLTGNVGDKMAELSQFRRDPLGPIPHSILPADVQPRLQMLSAYRALRLDHQREFAVYKLSADDRTFAGLSLGALGALTEHLAAVTLVLALTCSITRLFVAFAWSPTAAVSLAVTGVAVRAWRDGFALEPERERYQEMLHELELLTTRWESAEDDERRFHIAEEVERAGLEELRSFIRTHERAQFLL